MVRAWVAALVVTVGGTALADTSRGGDGASGGIDPRASPIAFTEPVYGGPHPDELRVLERGGMSTFTARYVRDRGQTIILYSRLYSRAGDGALNSRRTVPAEVRERFIPPGGAGHPVGGGTTMGAGRAYAFERYELSLSGHAYGCFVATSAARDDLVLVNQCRTDPAVPEEAEVVEALAGLRVVQPPREPDALALRGGKRI